MAEKTVFCVQCGTQNDPSSKFCIKCGAPMAQAGADGIKYTANEDAQSGSIFDSATSHLNSWTGGQGAVKVSWRDFFSEVFKSHSESEAEEVFIVGTKTTTPKLTEVANDAVHPWLFSRVLLGTILAGVLLSLFNSMNQATGDQVAMDVVIAFAVPLSALILFFEINVYKNISIYKIAKIFILGGILALLVTMIFNRVIGVDEGLNLIGASMTGIVEETAKVIIAAYFVRKLEITRTFNGLLVGAAVGSGFAAFENIQYMVDGNGQLLSMGSAMVRAAYSIADHTEWCAIATAALVLAKGAHKLTMSTFADGHFLRFFILVILIHACWDWSLFDNIANVRYLVLAIITWITIFIMIHAGLREVKELQLSINQVAQPTVTFQPNGKNDTTK